MIEIEAARIARAATARIGNRIPAGPSRNPKARLKANLKKIINPAIRRLRPAPSLFRRPLSTKWGYDRGLPTYRFHIDRFLDTNRDDVTGNVLEIKNRRYTNGLGRDVENSDVMDIDASNPDADIIADLATADDVPSDTYDCFILTETLQLIYDFQSAVRHAHRILKPGGVLLVTVPCTAPLDQELVEFEHWRFTATACRRIFSDAFGPDHVEVRSYGNFTSCLAGVAGLAVEDLEPEWLDGTSEMYAQGVCIRARKNPAAATA